MKRLAPLLIALILTCGCALSPTRQTRQLYIQNNAGLPENTKSAIASGHLITGMTKSDVTASLGRPNDIHTIATPTGTTEVWTYGSCAYGCTTVYFNAKGESFDIIATDNR